MRYKFLLTFLLLNNAFLLFSQETTTLFGKITDGSGNAVFMVNISIEGGSLGTISDKNGRYELHIPTNTDLTIIYSCIGFQTIRYPFKGSAAMRTQVDQVLAVSYKTLEEVQINSNYDRTSNLTRINVKTLDMLPNTAGGVESLIKTLPGVSSNNELSSQYSVRGGNFDENLVYVNDIEVYRPFLIRSGQQEGLSFINPDLVSSVQFSAGGFDATYGDKMSSVLDVSYKEPSQYGGSATASLLGGSLHFEGADKNKKFTHISGIRYKTSEYLLGSLDTKGEYRPSFFDFQTYLKYRFNSKFDISFLGNIAQNEYNFIPVSQETTFGTVSTALKLKVYYDGNEVDKYNTNFGAITASFHPTEKLNFKFILAAYNSQEQETYDIQGQYLINQLDNTAGSATFGDSIKNIGVGTFLNHARNYYMMNAWSISQIGSFSVDGHKFKWGAKFQQEYVSIKLSEWNLIDSSGYTIPFSDNTLSLENVIKSNYILKPIRLSGFFQDTKEFKMENGTLYLSAGLRANYFSLNRQTFINPRLSLAWDPNRKSDLLFRFSTGLYYQPPSYRELLDPNGNINTNLLAQRSFHILAGTDYTFHLWDRPFKFTAEAYFKYMNDLDPYKIDDVRVIYLAQNNARGFATGIDFKINGEFVEGTESWASLSLMRSMEEIIGDY
jgi:CarboxypepD_reg-like domain/TonB-dependent Receptor Plug Domain